MNFLIYLEFNFNNFLTCLNTKIFYKFDRKIKQNYVDKENDKSKIQATK